MPPPLNAKRRLGRLLTLSGGISLLILLGVLFSSYQGRSDIESQLAQDQFTITRLLASRIETDFNALEILLSDLAADMGRIPADQVAEELPALQERQFKYTIKALYIRDRQGNILASADPQGLANGALPIHLLATPTRVESGQRLVRLPEPCLLISERSPEPGVADQELIALISLKDLLRPFPSRIAKDQILLFAANGELLLPFKEGAGQPSSDLSQLMQQRLARPTSKAGAVLLPDIGPLKQGLIFSHVPLTLAGGGYSVGILGENPGLSALNSNALLGTALLFIALGGVGLLTCELYRGHRRTFGLMDQLETRQLQNAQLQQDHLVQQRRARQLLDFAGDARFFLNPDREQFVDQNQAACTLLGYSPEELARLDPDRLFPGQQKRRYRRLVRKVSKLGHGEEGELQFQRKDGTTFIGAVHVHLCTIGEQQLVQGTVRDVSQIKQIENELRRKNRDLGLLNRIAHRAAASQDLQSLFDGLLETVVHTLDTEGGGIFLLRHGGRDLHLAASLNIPAEVSQELRHITPGQGLIGLVAESGQPRSTANLGRDRRRWSDKVMQDGWKGFLAVSVRTGNRILGVLFIYNRTERVFSREETHLLQAIASQAGTAVEGTELLDALRWQNRLTEASNRELEASRHRLKENLLRQQEATRTLERLEQMKNNFLALASHELRTPLTYILAGSELLLENSETLNSQQQQLINAVHRGGERLQEIVSDLLEMARLEAQSIYLGREKIHLATLLASLGSSLSERLEQRQQQFTINLLPEVDLYGDPDHLGQALKRILENAMKFTPQGGFIEVSAHTVPAAELLSRQERLSPFTTNFFDRAPCGTYLQVAVRDNGVGVDKEEQVRIFDKFYEVGDITSHHTSQNGFGGKGVGLGLTLVRGMIEAHSGMVWVESAGTSNGGQGSSFQLVLPLGEGTDAATGKA